KTTLEKLRRLLFATKLRSEPTVEGVAVVDPLLSCQSGKAFRSDSEPVRRGVLLRASSGPRCCLVSAPRSGYGYESEDHCFDNFDRFKTGLRRRNVLAHLI